MSSDRDEARMGKEEKKGAGYHSRKIEYYRKKIAYHEGKMGRGGQKSEDEKQEVSEKMKNKDHFAPHLDHPQMKSGYPGTKITGKKGC
jgi:hypothetical protein